MAIVKTLSERWLLERGKGNVDFENDQFVAALMESEFTFDPAVDGTWADVSEYEIDDGNGYTAGGQNLVTKNAWAVSDGEASIDWEDVEWTADGGSIPVFRYVVFYNSSHTDDIIFGVIDLGEDISLADGMTFALQDIGFISKQKQE